MRRRLLVVLVALLAAVNAMPPATAAPASITIDSINGVTPTDGVVEKALAGRHVRVAGTTVTPRLTADAGDSAYVLRGEPAHLSASASYGVGPYRFEWSADRGTVIDPTSSSPTLDTTGLQAGPVRVELTVTDDAGATATDEVLAFVRTEREDVILDETVAAAPNAFVVGDEAEGRRFPFTVAPGTTDLRLTLDWTVPNDFVAVTLRAYDLTVDDPSGREDGNTTGAGFEKPERVGIDDPAPGEWAAIVTGGASAPDTYTVEALAVVTQPDPRPHLTTAAPYRFRSSDEQRLAVAVAGGTAPVSVAWDLDFDGLFESPGTEASTSFGLGNHFVAVKAIDSSGYERREVVPVLVSDEEPAHTPFVVVAVADTGINLYHDDFRAETYPNSAIAAATGNFTRHPSEYIPGFPSSADALPISLGEPFEPGKLRPASDASLFAPANVPKGKLFWVPGTKVVGVFDAGDSAPINAAPDATPILDDDGHGTASASVAVGNLYGFCPTCLLVFGEDISATAQIYSYDFVDIASNSFGSVGNVGFAGAVDPDFPKEQAEKGQIALYAAGNGNENAFITPEQTYTSETLGPDWVIRVGAVNRTTRKPFVGTGKPVDIASFGAGAIPAAANNDPSDTTSHSGTSAATPYSAGVFGWVLGRVRDVLGDNASGPKNEQGEFGVIARGAPILASPYLADGTLTRSELAEVILKTAEHDTSATEPTFPLTTPHSDLQYIFEGYGIVEPQSGARALAVLLAGDPLPSRPNEDEFFAADSLLRDALWGTWNGGGENSASQSPSGSGTAANPFGGTTFDEVLAFDDAFRLLGMRFGPFHRGAMVTASAPSGAPTASPSPSVEITSPVPGTVIDSSSQSQLTVSGTASFPFGPRPTEPTRFYPRRDPAVSCSEDPELWLGRVDGADSVCVLAGQAAGGVPVVNEVVLTGETFPVRPGDLPIKLDATVPVSGVIYVQGEFTPSPAHRIRVDLITGDTVLGSQEVTSSVDDSASGTPFPFVFSLPEAVHRQPLASLSLHLQHVISTGLTEFELNDAVSYIDLPIAVDDGIAPDAQVELSLDDDTFAAPEIVVPAADGTWTKTFSVDDISSGGRVVYARAVADGVRSAVASTSFIVARSTPVTISQVQIVPVGALPVADGWFAADVNRRDRLRWLATLDVSGLPAGDYEVHARVVENGATVAVSKPVRLALK